MLLAPVANYCDLAFRLVARAASRDGEAQGLGLACTDLLSPHGLLRGNEKSLDLAATNDADSPVCMQLYGGDAEILCEGARWAVAHGADVVDINMGCPVDKVTKKDGGSKLLCDPDRTVAMAGKIAMAVEKASNGRVPTTAKLRLGWDESCLVAPELAARLVRNGIRMVTVHGRTTEMRFKGEVRHEGIREVVEAVRGVDASAPVIGNGDVTEPWHAVEMIQATGCDGVMIGRGSFSAPWIFRRAWGLQRWCAEHPGGWGDLAAVAGELFPEPGEAEKIGLIRMYLRLMQEHRDDHYAMVHMKRRISWFGKRLGPCKPLKDAVRLAGSPGEVERALDAFLEGGLRVRARDEDGAVILGGSV